MLYLFFETHHKNYTRLKAILLDNTANHRTKMNSPRPLIVSIDGAIAVGKSTLCETLRSMGHIVYCEGADDPKRWGKSLERFYKDPSTCFALQVAILSDMRRLYNNICRRDVSIVFVERNPLSARDIFLQNSFRAGHINEVDRNVYLQLHEQLGWEPDYIISLETTPMIAFQRLVQRNRAAEVDVDISYIQDITRQYKLTVANWCRLIKANELKTKGVHSIDVSNCSKDSVVQNVLKWIKTLQ